MHVRPGHTDLAHGVVSDIPACWGEKAAAVTAPMQTAVAVTLFPKEMLFRKRHGVLAVLQEQLHRVTVGERLAVIGRVTRNSALQTEAKWVPTGFLPRGQPAAGQLEISSLPPSASTLQGTLPQPLRAPSSRTCLLQPVLPGRSQGVTVGSGHSSSFCAHSWWQSPPECVRSSPPPWPSPELQPRALLHI